MPLQHDDPRFTIIVDPARRYVELVLRGHWNDEDADRFGRELRAALRALPAAGVPLGQQVTLCDNAAFGVQSQGVSAKIGALTGDPTIGSRRIAVVIASALQSVQTKRVAPGYGVFHDRVQALAWLFADDGADMPHPPS